MGSWRGRKHLLIAQSQLSSLLGWDRQSAGPGAAMFAFEDIKPGSRLRGLASEGVAEIVQVARFGSDALNLVFRVNGKVAERLLYRGEEASFELVEGGRAYAFDADGGLL